MMGILKRVFVFSAFALMANCAFGQTVAMQSGMPGDGIPDVYYDPATGVATLDTDGVDAVAFFVGGPDVSVVGCSLCDTGPNDMPGAMADLSDFSSWTVGFSAGSTQWIRGAPLSGLGFVGVIGESWAHGAWPNDVAPFINFPEAGQGFANYGPGLTNQDFTRVFDDGQAEGVWGVQLGTDDGRIFFTDVTVVPEPASFGLLSLAGLALLGLRRR